MTSLQKISTVSERLREERRRHIASDLLDAERGWRLHPGDGGDPSHVSDRALARDLAIERKLLELCPPPGAEDALRQRLKHFPILFISAPHIEDGVTGSFPGMPTSLLYATSILDRLVRIDEFPAGRVPWTTAVMNPATYNGDFERELVEHLRTNQPQVVGISNLSEGHHYALRIARIVKRELPASIVILGGQHEDGVNAAAYRGASERAEAMSGRRWEVHALFRLSPGQQARLASLETLADPRERAVVDFVVSGDAPYALVELIRTIAELPGGTAVDVKRALIAARETFAALPGSGCVAFYDERPGRIERLHLSGETIDGNELPFIDVRRLTHENRFAVFAHKLTAQIMACLGCKYACAFCHESADAFLYDVSKFRQRGAAHVLHEMRLRRAQGYEAVFFDDSTFTQNPTWLNDFLDSLEKLGPGWMEWGCQTTINDVDLRTLGRMGEAGCSYIYFGVESARPAANAVQKVLQLRVTAPQLTWSSQFARVARWCRDAGIRVGTSLQFGLGESPEDRVTTLKLVAELHQEGCIPAGCVALNINSPYPGTRQWVELLRAGVPLPDYRERLIRHTAFETAHQFSTIQGQAVQDIYELAAEILGPALHVETKDR